MRNRNQMLCVIRRFVAEKRQELGIIKLPGPQPELSCEMFGEYHNLLWRKLLFMPESQWNIDDPETLGGLYREVTRLCRQRRNIANAFVSEHHDPSAI